MALICLFSFGFSQHQLTRLGTAEEIDIKVEATNAQPLLLVQNVVYAIPVDCFCNRDLGDAASGRISGKDDSGRDKDNRNADRNADADKSSRNSGKDDSGRNTGEDKSGRNLGTDFIYRDSADDGEERSRGDDDSDRDSAVFGASRNADTSNAGRKSDSDTNGRNSGNAANGRNASRDNLERSFATAYTAPSCHKVANSCSIQILGFHPKANVEYFDKVESIKANNMVIQF